MPPGVCPGVWRTFKPVGAEGEDVVLFQQDIRLGQAQAVAGEKHGLRRGLVQHLGIGFVDGDFGPGGVFQGLVGVHVVEMAVGVDDQLQLEFIVVQDLEDLGLVAPGIDDHGFFGLLVAQDIAIHFQ